MENLPNDALRRLAELYQQGRMQELLSASQPLLLQFPNSAPLLTLIVQPLASTSTQTSSGAASLITPEITGRSVRPLIVG